MPNLLIILFAVALLVFLHVYPEFDVLVSSFFYEDSFFLIKNKLYASIIKFIHIAFVVAHPFFFCAQFIKLSLRKFIFLTIKMVLCGPILLYAIVKPLLYRARPIDCIIFNGKEKFTPLFKFISDSGDSSFMSGHVTLVMLYLFYTKLDINRKQYIIILLAALHGISRVSIGMHFLSDIVFSLIFNFFIWYTLEKLEQYQKQ